MRIIMIYGNLRHQDRAFTSLLSGCVRATRVFLSSNSYTSFINSSIIFTPDI